MTHEVNVTCDPRERGWTCRVRVGDDPGATEHLVEVDRETMSDLAPAAAPDDLVRESFAFLLDHEPRESIMRSFELPIIGRFFADYADAMRSRFGR